MLPNSTKQDLAETIPLLLTVYTVALYFCYDLLHVPAFQGIWGIGALVVVGLCLLGYYFSRHALFWGVLAIIFFTTGSYRVFQLANHHWVLFYLCLMSHPCSQCREGTAANIYRTKCPLDDHRNPADGSRAACIVTGIHVWRLPWLLPGEWFFL